MRTIVLVALIAADDEDADVKARRGSAAWGVAAALVATGLVLGGCSDAAAPGPGIAAVVRGQSVSESDLLTTTRQLQDAQLKATPAMVLTYLVIADKTLAAGEQRLMEAGRHLLANVSGLESAAVKADPEPRRRHLHRGDPQGPHDRRRAADLAPNDQQAILTGVKEPDVVISPRYGTFDPAQGLVPVTPNWMVKPAATGSAAVTIAGSPPAAGRLVLIFTTPGRPGHPHLVRVGRPSTRPSTSGLGR